MTSHRLVSASTVVDAPPSVVFAILADPRQHARVDGSGTVLGLVEGPERLSEGARFSVSMRLFGLPYRIGNRVVEYDEDRVIAWRHFGAHRWRYELTPTDDGGTLVTESFDYTRAPAPVAKALELLGFRGRNRRGIEATLRRLRDAAEADLLV